MCLNCFCSLSPFVSEFQKIHLTEEPSNSWSPTVDGTPKVDGLLGKQASSSILERKKMQVIEFMFENKFQNDKGN